MHEHVHVMDTGFVLPRAPNTTINACGESKILPAYTVAAEDFERAVAELHRNEIRRYLLQLTAGTALLTETMIIRSRPNNLHDQALDIVIAGQQPQGWLSTTQPPTSTEIETHINLQQHSIEVSQEAPEARTAFCMMDLRLHKGKVCSTSPCVC